jgi:hypothetical protein
MFNSLVKKREKDMKARNESQRWEHKKETVTEKEEERNEEQEIMGEQIKPGEIIT